MKLTSYRIRPAREWIKMVPMLLVLLLMAAAGRAHSFSGVSISFANNMIRSPTSLADGKVLVEFNRKQIAKHVLLHHGRHHCHGGDVDAILRGQLSLIAIISQKIRKLTHAIKCHVKNSEIVPHQFQLSLAQHRLEKEQYIATLLAGERYSDPRCLARHRRQVFSEYGQDGFLSEIFHRLRIKQGTFVEVGVHPMQSNTTYLLMVGWQGRWIDPIIPQDTELPEGLRRSIEGGRLHISRECATPGNLSSFIREKRKLSSVDLISVDIDYNTHHLWEPLCVLNPKVAVLEYNAHIPPSDDWSTPYDSQEQWQDDIIYGAGLKTLEKMGRKLGYSLVGCELSGTDAFFVRNDLLGDLFLPPYTAERHYEPPRFFLALAESGHRRSFPKWLAKDFSNVTFPRHTFDPALAVVS